MLRRGCTPPRHRRTKRTSRASYRGGVQEKRRISDGNQKREPTWETAHDKSGIGVQAAGRFWRSDRRGGAPTQNIDFWGFEDIDQKFVQLVNNVPFYNPHSRNVRAASRVHPTCLPCSAQAGTFYPLCRQFSGSLELDCCQALRDKPLYVRVNTVANEYAVLRTFR